MFEEVAPGVFSVSHRHVEGKNGIVIGERTAVAIDTGTYPDEGQAMAKFIQERGLSSDRLIYTHGHNDHILGSHAFKDGEVIASALTLSVMQQTLSASAKRQDTSLEQLEAQVAWPTITFTGELHLDLGGKHIRLFPTPGHSDDSISVYVEEDRVLIAADAIFSGIVPAIGAGDGRQLESTLHTFKEMEIEVIVPGHGAVLRGPNNIKEWLDWELDYLGRIRTFVREELNKGNSAEIVAGLTTFDKFIGGRLPIGKHGMVNRHRGTVTKIIQEELG